MNNHEIKALEAASSRDGLLAHLRVSVIATFVLAVIVCGVYPLAVWGLAQLMFPHQANGSLMMDKEGRPIGSELLGQNFTDAKYFHSRPSAAGNGYDATSSGGSNLGPMSAKLILGTIKKDDKGNDVVDFDGISDRIVHYCVENGIALESSSPIEGFRDAAGNLDDVKLIKAFNDAERPLTIKPKILIPADAVTASGSGLDPHISVANAELQAGRVAAARKLPLATVRDLVGRNTEGPDLGILGEAGVNVLRLNWALDQLK